MTSERPVFTPILLQGRRVIATTFRVRPCVVTQWAKEGAPIFLSGQMWQADYVSLVHWLEENRPAFSPVA